MIWQPTLQKESLLKMRDSFVGSKMHKQYGKIKYMLLFFMEKIATATFARFNQYAKKSRNLAGTRECSSIFHLFLLCIYLASENAGNVFSFRLGSLAQPQKYTGQFLIIVWLLMVQSVFKLVRNIYIFYWKFMKSTKNCLFSFSENDFRNKTKSLLLIGSYLTQYAKAGGQLIIFSLQLTQNGFPV